MLIKHTYTHTYNQGGTQDVQQRRQDKINVSISDILEYCKTPKSIKEILEFCGVHKFMLSASQVKSFFNLTVFF